FRIIPLFLFLLCLLPQLLLSQTSLNGTIVDRELGETLPGAYIFLKTQEGEILSNAISDDKGNFTIKRPEVNTFVMEVSFLGYEKYTREIQNLEGSSLGTIELEMESTQLEAFEIQGTTLAGEVKGDTVAFNAEAFKTRP